MARNRFQTYALAAALLAGIGTARATTIVGAIEDWPGSTGYEKNGDFNDMMFELTGNITMIAPGGVLTDLSAAAVNENGSVFWDNPSLDGHDMNVGYQLLAATGLPPLQYLATPSGGSVNDVTFSATGPITLTYLGGLAANRLDTMGWESLSNPGVLQQLISITNPLGTTVTFTPNGAFALYSSNGWGQIYNSVASNNIGESGTQQHFAFFPDPPPPSVPEPSSAALGGIGVLLMGARLIRRKQNSSVAQKG